MHGRWLNSLAIFNSLLPGSNMSESKKESKKPKFTPDDVDEDIPHPYYELYRHTLLRGANAGSVLPLVFAPPILYLRGIRKPGEILYRTARASLYGVVSHLLFS